MRTFMNSPESKQLVRKGREERKKKKMNAALVFFAFLAFFADKELCFVFGKGARESG